MEKLNVRPPVVSGLFYPSSNRELTKQIEGFVDKKAVKYSALGCVLPHAGYVYSGAVAAETVSRIDLSQKDKIIILGPNHTGNGPEMSIMTEGFWQTPLGEIEIDSALAKKILKRSKFLRADSLAHEREHSIEVELPILQHFKESFDIVPICIMSGDAAMLTEAAGAIAGVVKESGKERSFLIVASSDMTHYEPLADAQKKDKEAIDAILQLDPEKLLERVRLLDISMCGYAPVFMMLKIAKALGAKKAELVKYQTSAQASGDISSVVGYAGITVN